MGRWFVILAMWLAAPAAAQASTIVYVKDHNIWLVDMTTGTRHAVTTDGTTEEPYFSPSQDDAGRIVAVKGKGISRYLHRMDQTGNPLNAPFVPSGLGSAGPFEPQVSPDGSIVGYHSASSDSPCYMSSCPGGSTTARYTRADGNETAAESPGGFADVSWVSNSQTLVFSNSVWVSDVATGAAASWVMADNDPAQPSHNRNIQDGELSRDGGRLAVVLAHYADQSGYIQLYAANGFDTAPSQTCRILAQDDSYNSTFSDPTWSPDGTHLAWAEPDGIHVARVEYSGACTVSNVSTLDGQEPDWSPAAYAPPARQGADPGTGSQPAPGTNTGTGTGTETGTGTGTRPDPGAGSGARPTLSALKIKRRSIAFSLSERSRVILRFKRMRPGKRPRFVGRLRAVGDAGPNVLKWNGRVAGKRLGKGTYRVIVVAIDSNGSRSKKLRVLFVRR